MPPQSHVVFNLIPGWSNQEEAQSDLFRSVTTIYFGLSWFSVFLVIVLLAIDLWNTEGLANGERDFTQYLTC